jgi:hypothetical protein
MDVDLVSSYTIIRRSPDGSAIAEEDVVIVPADQWFGSEQSADSGWAVVPFGGFVMASRLHT